MGEGGAVKHGRPFSQPRAGRSLETCFEGGTIHVCFRPSHVVHGDREDSTTTTGSRHLPVGLPQWFPGGRVCSAAGSFREWGQGAARMRGCRLASGMMHHTPRSGHQIERMDKVPLPRSLRDWPGVQRGHTNWAGSVRRRPCGLRLLPANSPRYRVWLRRGTDDRGCLARRGPRATSPLVDRTVHAVL